jgi:hypothetical protein
MHSVKGTSASHVPPSVPHSARFFWFFYLTKYKSDPDFFITKKNYCEKSKTPLNLNLNFFYFKSIFVFFYVHFIFYI